MNGVHTIVSKKDTSSEGGCENVSATHYDTSGLLCNGCIFLEFPVSRTSRESINSCGPKVGRAGGDPRKARW